MSDTERGLLDLQDYIELRLDQIMFETRMGLHTLARSTGQYLKVKK